MIRLAFRLTVMLAILAGFVVLPAPAQATFPGKNGRIAFGTQRAPDNPYSFDAYTINPDGSGFAKLIDDGGMARWSPDGSKVAFRSPDIHTCCHHASELYVMKADGSGLTQLTRFNESGLALADIFSIEWSPDGTEIAFVVSDFRRSQNLYVIHPDGSGLTTLAANASDPGWSPDSSRIAFEVPAPDLAGNGIDIVSADGSGLTTLTPHGYLPDWSPDGKKIAFMRLPPSDTSELWTVKPDGSQLTQLAIHDAYYGFGAPPLWSPDGTKILWGVNVLRPDGTILAVVEGKVWSPDGNELAFVDMSQLSTDANPFPEDVYVEHADGTGKRRLTNHPQLYLVTDWQAIPEPKRGDYKNAAKYCKAEQAFWGDRFSQRYGNFGRCVSGSK